MPLEELLEANKAFVQGREARALQHLPARRLVVLTCMDCRLSGFLAEALGLRPGDAVVLRNAGARLTQDVLRSLVVAVYAQSVNEIAVVGHRDCGMARLSVGELTTAMSKAGVSREALPNEDLASWLGVCANPEQSVREAVATIRASQVLPKGLVVYGLLLDEVTGELTVIERAA